MTAKHTYPIDWRQEIGVIQPYFSGRGGVIAVEYFGAACAPEAFVETLKSLHDGGWENGCFVGSGTAVSLVVDADNYRVRYMPGLRSQFLRKLGIDPVVGDSGATMASSTFGSGNHAGGNQTISMEINYHSDEDDPDRVEQRDRWVAKVINELDAYLDCGRFMLLVMADLSRDQREFWRDIWDAGMSRLVDKGLLLVRMIDLNARNSATMRGAPTPNDTIVLSPRLDDTQRIHAIEDIAAWIKRRIQDCGDERARTLAEAYVADHAENLERLHSAGAWIMKLVQQASRLK